jgi:hypothetical protein
MNVKKLLKLVMLTDSDLKFHSDDCSNDKMKFLAFALS